MIPPATRGREVEGRTSAVASAWTVLGVAAVFAWAVYRLGRRGIDAVRAGLDGLEWTALVLLTVGFVYGEGIRALDQRWIPGLVERARRLRYEPGVLLRVLGPLYGLCLIGRDAGELVRGWLGTAGIVVAVLVIRAFPDPWRGIVDFAVAAALAWGLVAILRSVPRAVE